MNIKTVSIIIVICVAAASDSWPITRGASDSSRGAEAQERRATSDALNIYLPREVTIEDNSLKLGRVSVIRGQASLAAKASEIVLGCFSAPGQRIVVDRSTIMSMLASNGIPAWKVTLSGAEQISVIKRQQVIKSSEFLELAGSFLKENLSADSVYQFNPVRVPKDFILPELGKEIKLSPRLVKNIASNQVKVQISVLSAGKEIEVIEVSFRLKFNVRNAVTLAEISANEVISPENVKIENTVSDYPEPVSWYPPYGFIARRKLPANTVIKPDMVTSVKPDVAIKRNDTVVIRIEKPGLLITAVGKSMQDGKVGECIKVRNTDSQRIIFVKVKGNGIVEPIF